jgi:lysine 2,3-aminomutase
VIFTGGDPLILSPRRLKTIINKIADIPHVEVIRIHTRIPVVDSKRITPSLLNALKIKKALFILLHANHANEFTEQATNACRRIINAGIPMLGQSVLLKGINDNVEALKNLFRTFVKNRIKPHYLHHCDLAKGTSHFRSSLEKGQELLKELRGHISGLCQPTYVLDLPGGHGKVPINPYYIQKIKDQEYLLEDFQGNFHTYTSHDSKS